MYRNSEGYADPTAGAALAHIAYEERKQKRLIKQKQKKATEEAASIAALRKKEQEKHRRAIRNQQRKTDYSTQTWVKGWPKEQSSESYGLGGNA